MFFFFNTRIELIIHLNKSKKNITCRQWLHFFGMFQFISNKKNNLCNISGGSKGEFVQNKTLILSCCHDVIQRNEVCSVSTSLRQKSRTNCTSISPETRDWVECLCVWPGVRNIYCFKQEKSNGCRNSNHYSRRW